VDAVRLHGVAGSAELVVVIGEDWAVSDGSCAGAVAWRVEPRAVVGFLRVLLFVVAGGGAAAVIVIVP